MQILPNVYLVNGFAYALSQNGYLLRLGKDLVLIDSGDERNDTFDVVCANCRMWGFAPEQITRLLVTHAHFDHSSHAARFQKMGVKIVGSRQSAEAMRTGDDRCIGYAVHQRFEPCVVDQIVEDGEEMAIGEHRIRCIYAPGHAVSCMVYEIVLEGRRIWFVGDIIRVNNEGTAVQLGWNGGPDYDRKAYIESLRKLCHLECDCLMPGHGTPVIGGAKRHVEMAYKMAMMTLR